MYHTLYVIALENVYKNATEFPIKPSFYLLQNTNYDINNSFEPQRGFTQENWPPASSVRECTLFKFLCLYSSNQLHHESILLQLQIFPLNISYLSEDFHHVWSNPYRLPNVFFFLTELLMQQETGSIEEFQEVKAEISLLASFTAAEKHKNWDPRLDALRIFGGNCW